MRGVVRVTVMRVRGVMRNGACVMAVVTMMATGGVAGAVMSMRVAVRLAVAAVPLAVRVHQPSGGHETKASPTEVETQCVQVHQSFIVRERTKADDSVTSEARRSCSCFLKHYGARPSGFRATRFVRAGGPGSVLRGRRVGQSGNVTGVISTLAEAAGSHNPKHMHNETCPPAEVLVGQDIQSGWQIQLDFALTHPGDRCRPPR